MFSAGCAIPHTPLRLRFGGADCLLSGEPPAVSPSLFSFRSADLHAFSAPLGPSPAAVYIFFGTETPPSSFQPLFRLRVNVFQFHVPHISVSGVVIVNQRLVPVSLLQIERLPP